MMQLAQTKTKNQRMRFPGEGFSSESLEQWRHCRRDASGIRIDPEGSLPMPAPLYLDGQRLPASYANFYISNAAVLVPTFNDPQDRIALGTLAELFRDRPVVGIHAVDLGVGFGDAALPDARTTRPLARIIHEMRPVGSRGSGFAALLCGKALPFRQPG